MSETPPVNLTQEAVTAVLEMCDASTLNGNIDNLEWVEDELQKKAEESGGSDDYLFRYAYHVKLIRRQFENLLNALGYERYRE